MGPSTVLGGQAGVLGWDGRAWGGVARTKGAELAFWGCCTGRSPGTENPQQADRPPRLAYRGHDGAKVPRPSHSTRGGSRDARPERVARVPYQPSPTPKALPPLAGRRSPGPLGRGKVSLEAAKSAEVLAVAQTPPRNLSRACGIAGVQKRWLLKGSWQSPLGSEVAGVGSVDPRG